MNQTKQVPPQKSANVALAKDLGRFLEGTNTLVGIKDLEHRYLFANKSLELLHGAVSGGLFGVKSEALVNNEHIAAEILARENYVIQIGKPAHFIERVHIKGEQHIWQTIRFPFFDQNGSLIGTGFIAIDNGDNPELTDEQRKTLERARAKAEFIKKHGTALIHVSAIPVNAAEDESARYINLHWSKIYECGNPTIDHQHRELCEQSHQLVMATVNCKPRAEVIPMVRSLLDKVSQHFRDEENILRKAFFPHAKEHQKAHATIAASATALFKQYEDEKFEQNELIYFLVYDMFFGHLLEEDRKYFAYLDPDFPLTPDD